MEPFISSNPRIMSERYRVVCHSCEVDEIRDSLLQAQSFFSTHATDECEVVLEKVTTAEYSPADEAGQTGREQTDSQRTID